MRRPAARLIAATSLATALLALVGGCDSMAAKPAMASPPAMAMNGMLMAPGGMTLYTFDKDTAGSGASTCTGGCATVWPPLLAKAGDMPSGDYSLVTRDDGSKQWAFKGWPLYTYSKDSKSGDMTGDNFKGVWHAAKS